MRHALVFLLIFLSPHNGLTAIPPDGEDVFGMYANDNFNDDPSDENPPYVIGEGLIQVYIYLTNVSAPAITAFEFALVYTGPGEAPDMTDLGLPPSGGTNFGTPPDYIVGLATPLLRDEYGHAILMSPTYFVAHSDPVYVLVTPVSTPSIPGQICYAQTGSIELFVMNPASGNFVDPIFAFNAGIVATENATWSAVKGLYR